jgi:hypothetical protein
MILASGNGTSCRGLQPTVATPQAVDTADVCECNTSRGSVTNSHAISVGLGNCLTRESSNGSVRATPYGVD